MTTAIITAIALFLSTTVDDFLVLAVSFSTSKDRHERRNIWIGSFLGIFLIYVIGMAGGWGIQQTSWRFTQVLGVAPIILGLRYLFNSFNEPSQAEGKPFMTYTIPRVLMLTFADSADNFAAYVPVFSTMTVMELLVSGVIFVLLTFVLLYAAQKFSELPAVQVTIRKYSRYLVPGILVILGVLILFGI